MQTIYLLRHGQPVQQGPHTCGYSRDVPLDAAGERQAEDLRKWARARNIGAIYSSPLLRCVQTAYHLSENRIPVYLEDSLKEVDTGIWTGLTFDEIQKNWPEEYALRGRAFGTTVPPGGESFSHAGKRMEQAVRQILSHVERDIILVAHGGINRGWLCQILGLPWDSVMSLPQPWGGITEIQADQGRFSVLRIGIRPRRWPESSEIRTLWDKYSTPELVRAHCKQVAECALKIAGQCSHPVERELLESACLLHDLVRDRPNHPQACGDILIQEGYPELARMVAVHHDLPEDARAEDCLLYLADKLIKGTQSVSLDERFVNSRNRCATPGALAAWERRYQRARKIMEQMNLNTEGGM